MRFTRNDVLIRAAVYLVGVVGSVAILAGVDKLPIGDNAKFALQAFLGVGLFIVAAAWLVVHFRDHDDSP